MKPSDYRTFGLSTRNPFKLAYTVHTTLRASQLKIEGDLKIDHAGLSRRSMCGRPRQRLRTAYFLYRICIL